MYAKFHHNILLSSRDSAIITFFRIFSSAKPRSIKNVISQSLGLDLVNINVYATVYQNIPLSLRDRAVFTFFQNLRSAKPRQMKYVILLFLEPDLVNINVSAKFYQNIPNVLRVKFHCFQNLNLGKTSTNPKCHLTISWPIMSVSLCMQNFITIFHSDQEIGPFSLFQNLELETASTDEKCQFAISWARSCLYQCLRKSLSKYSTQFKR